MTQTRQTFANLSHWEIVFWYCLIVVSTAVFFWGVVRLLVKYRQGRGQVVRSEPQLVRVRRTLWIVFTHAWIKRRDGVAGLAHAAIFYGFLVLLAGTTILGFEDDFAKPVLGFEFFYGTFYLVYSLFLDVFGFALLVGLCVMAVKRLRKPFRLDYRRPDRAEGEYDRRVYVIGDWAFLGALLFLGVTGFLLEAFRIAEVNPSFEKWSPFGWSAAQVFRAAGLKGQSAQSAHFVQWWVHGVAALVFVASIPFTKAVHMLASPANVLERDELAGKRLPPLPVGAKPDEVG